LRKTYIKIKVSKNGPYTISGKPSLSEQIIIPNTEGDPHQWRKREEYKVSDKYDLCRCGQSRTKPFCDKSHIKANFDGTETADQEPYLRHAKTIEGPEIKLTDIEDLCASARFCHREGGIWTLTPKSDNPETKNLVIQESHDCPSGRLVVWDKKTKKALEPILEQSIGLIEDPQMGISGPIWVRGCIPIESADRKLYTIRNRVTLCRCGKSTNKPFCDSSHYPEEHEHEGKP
jgi:CDGSH-type Zn-finger protein